MEKLSHDKFVRLDDLVSLLDTSESTVRRDLDELESERKLHRVHGGAELPHSLQEEFTNQQKSNQKHSKKKCMVAKKAASLISNDDVVFVDAGTTNELLLGYLSQDNLTVVTNSIHHAAKLVDKTFRPLLLVGMLRNQQMLALELWLMSKLSS